MAAVRPRHVLGLPGRVNLPGARRVLIAVAKPLANLAGDLLERGEVGKRRHVNGDEKVSQKARAPRLVAVLVDVRVRKLRAPPVVLQRGTHDLDDGGVAVPFVSGHLVAGAAERGEARRALDKGLKDGLAVGHLDAVLGEHGTSRRGLALPRVLFDLAALVDRRGTVQHERERVGRRHAKHDRVGAHHRLDAVGGRNRGPGVGARDADAAVGVGLERVVPRKPVVGGVAHHDHAHAAVRLGLVDGELHALGPDAQSNATAAVDDGRVPRLPHDPEPRPRPQDARVHALAVDALEPPDPMRVDAALVRRDQHIGADVGVPGCHAVPLERVAHELLQVVERDRARARRRRTVHALSHR